MSKILTGMAWKYHKSLIDEDKGIMGDCGVGDDAELQTGYTKKQIADAIWKFHEEVFRMGALLFMFNETTLYVHRRDKCVDVGTRRDFEELGWGKICDLLDYQSKHGCLPEGVVNAD